MQEKAPVSLVFYLNTQLISKVRGLRISIFEEAFMTNQRRPTTGGLLKDLKPNESVKVKDCNYTIANVGLYPIRIRIYQTSSQESDNAENTRTGGKKSKE